MKDMRKRKTNKLLARKLGGSVPMEYELSEARRGCIYALSTIDFKYLDSPLEFSLTANYIGGGGVVSLVRDKSNQIMEKLGLESNPAILAAKKAKSKVTHVLDDIRQWVSRAVRELIQSITGSYGDGIKYINWFGELAQYLVSELVYNISTSIAFMGVVQGIGDLVDGVRQGYNNFSRFVKQLYRGRGVSVAEGHPSYIARAISSQSIISSLEGLAAAGVASAKFATTGTGIDLIISLVYNLFNRLYLFINSIVQKKLLIGTLNRAKSEWANDSNSSPLHKNPHDFNQWFKERIVFTPVIGYILVCSGYLAHPYKFINLLASKGSLISPGEYQRSEKYIKQIQSNGGYLLRSYSDVHNVSISSTDPVLACLLNSVTSGEKILITHDKTPSLRPCTKYASSQSSIGGNTPQVLGKVTSV